MVASSRVTFRFHGRRIGNEQNHAVVKRDRLMCEPVKRLKLPEGLKYCCDAVASFYLHDREHAVEKFLEFDIKFFENRQRLIESLKDGLLEGVVDKRSLDVWLWGKLKPQVVFDNNTLSTLVLDLESLGQGESWSLQVLPASVTQTGHHVALGRSPDGQHWWLLDPASCIYVFSSLGDLAKYTAKLFANSQFSVHSRTVLLRVA
jgi:hypothetical protein